MNERKEGLLKRCTVDSPGTSKIFLLGWESTEFPGAWWSCTALLDAPMRLVDLVSTDLTPKTA